VFGTLRMKQVLKRNVAHLIHHISYHSDYGILRPSTIAISMTNRCNSKCLTCSYWNNNSIEEELTTAEWKDIISRIKDWYGPFKFTIGGGEPLMRKDICDVISHAVNIGSHPSIITNGLLLSKKRISELIDAGLKEIVISLNGIKEETHDFTRGIRGGFQKIMNSIEELQKYHDELVIGIATILMGYNMDEASNLVRWVKKKGLDRITFQALFYETGEKAYKNGWYKDSELWTVKRGTYHEHIDELILLKEVGYPIANTVEQLRHFNSYFLKPDQKLPIPCKIGIHGFFVDPNGNVMLCYLFNPIGNLNKDNPRDVWNSQKARSIRKKIKKCQLNCRLKNCNYVA
jgi:MoaA/NifB/PqqE/SkfB family radical SAM enzyme